MLRASSEFFGMPPSGGGKVPPYILAQSAVAVTAPVDTNEDTLATISVPANALGANGSLRIQTSFTLTNNANNKTLRIRWSGIGGTAVSSYVVPSVINAYPFALVSNRNLTNSQFVFTTCFLNNAAAFVNPATTAAIDTTVATTIVITGQKATGTDILTLESYLVELLYAV